MMMSQKVQNRFYRWIITVCVVLVCTVPGWADLVLYLPLDGDAMDYPFAGMVDEARIYNRALSDAEVAGLAGLTQPVAKTF